jgi:hypothetical protein
VKEERERMSRQGRDGGIGSQHEKQKLGEPGRRRRNEGETSLPPGRANDDVPRGERYGINTA